MSLTTVCITNGLEEPDKLVGDAGHFFRAEFPPTVFDDPYSASEGEEEEGVGFFDFIKGPGGREDPWLIVDRDVQQAGCWRTAIVIVVPTSIASEANGLGASLNVLESRQRHETSEGMLRVIDRGTPDEVPDREQSGWTVVLPRKAEEMHVRPEGIEVVDHGERFTVQEVEKDRQDLPRLYDLVGELDLA